MSGEVAFPDCPTRFYFFISKLGGKKSLNVGEKSDRPGLALWAGGEGPAAQGPSSWEETWPSWSSLHLL